MILAAPKLAIVLVATSTLLIPGVTAEPINPELDDPVEPIRDLLRGCYNQTAGAEVGYDIKLTSEFTVGNNQIIAHSHPYFAVGVFEFLGFDGDYWRYLILSGYTFYADDCGENAQLRARVLMV